MRDAAVAGPSLRETHANVGRYLETEYVSQLVGLEDYDIAHVQGHSTTAHGLRNENRTSIVALMRGGEAVAFGINEVFPKAMFVHALCADDNKLHHI
jgi:uracil phosphoribosyltransferase